MAYMNVELYTFVIYVLLSSLLMLVLLLFFIIIIDINISSAVTMEN